MIEGLAGVVRDLGLPTLVGVVLGWVLQEWSRQRQASLERREAHYGALMAALSAFYEKDRPSEQPPAVADAREAFLESYRRAWLYASDAVLAAGDAFLNAVSTGSAADDATRERKAREFVMAMRKDLQRRTRLSARDFQVWSAR
jgi:hypothetical protein